MDRDLEREAWDKARLSLFLSLSRYSLMEFSNVVQDAGSIIHLQKSR